MLAVLSNSDFHCEIDREAQLSTQRAVERDLLWTGDGAIDGLSFRYWRSCFFLLLGKGRKKRQIARFALLLLVVILSLNARAYRKSFFFFFFVLPSFLPGHHDHVGSFNVVIMTTLDKLKRRWCPAAFAVLCRRSSRPTGALTTTAALGVCPCRSGSPLWTGSDRRSCAL